MFSCWEFPTVALVLFCWFTANNGFAWLMFAPVTEDLIRMYFPFMTARQLELLNSWQPLMYLVACYPLTLLQSSHNGLRKAVIVGTSVEVVGALLKLGSSTVSHSTTGLWMLHIGQVFSALASPIAIGAPALLSATWFPHEMRTRATAAAVLFNNVGNAVCYLLIPTMTHYFGYQSVMIFEVASAVGAFGCVFVVFPSTYTPEDENILAGSDSSVSPAACIGMSPSFKSKHKTMSAAQRLGLSVAKQLKLLFSNPSAVILCLVYAWTSGGSVAWTALFDEILGRRGFSDVFIGALSFTSTISYVAGGLVSSFVADVYLPRKFKKIIVACSVMNTISCVFFLFSIPASASVIAALPVGNIGIAFFSAMCGFFNGASAPMYYELLAEISYPVNEAVSGNVMSMGENLGALVMFQVVVRYFSIDHTNEVFAFGMVLASILASLVHEEYNRYAFESSPSTPFPFSEHSVMTIEPECKTFGTFR